MGLPPRQPKKTNVGQGIPAKCHRQRAVAVAGETNGRDNVETSADEQGPERSFVAPMLANANLARAKRIASQRATTDTTRSWSLMCVSSTQGMVAWPTSWATDAKQVAFKSLRVEVNDTSAKIRHAFAQFLGRRTLHLYDPPFAVELEAQRWPLAAPAWGRGGLFHLKEAVVRNRTSLRGQLDGEAALLGHSRFDHPRQGSAGAALAAASRLGQFLASEPTRRHDLGHHRAGG
jgi:hypothetical protein